MLKKKFILISGVLFLIMTTSGCLTIKTVEHERVDLGLQGNKGYILGQPKYKKEEIRNKTRKIIQINVDFSDFQGYGPPGKVEEGKSQPQRGKKPEEIEKLPKGLEAKYGEYNKGYIETKAIKKEPREYKAEYIGNESKKEELKQAPSYSIYTVKKNESLWDIAGKPEIYGDSTKWTLIYEANKDKIKKPDLIKAGMELKIPR